MFGDVAERTWEAVQRVRLEKELRKSEEKYRNLFNSIDDAFLIIEPEEEAASLYSTHRIVFAPVEETFIHADPDKIGQVISNLISNAVKYSPSGTLIQTACVMVDGKAIVSVKDQGIGIINRKTSRSCLNGITGSTGNTHPTHPVLASAFASAAKSSGGMMAIYGWKVK